MGKTFSATPGSYVALKAACGHTQRARKPYNEQAWEWVRRNVESEVCGRCWNAERLAAHQARWEVAA